MDAYPVKVGQCAKYKGTFLDNNMEGVGKLSIESSANSLGTMIEMDSNNLVVCEVKEDKRNGKGTIYYR